MRVLSLFDGISAAQVALNRLEIKIEKYYASEIDPHAIKITQKNFPNTIQLGDVTRLYEFDLFDIDLLIGGSPCQGFSFAGKQLNFNDPRSKLFFEYVDILRDVKPKYFLLENVVMKKEYQDIISRELGVEPILINSNLLSGQVRKRLYWTNIPNITQPENKEILLIDVLEDGYFTERDKSHAIISSIGRTTKREYFTKNQGQMVFSGIPVIKSHGTYQLRPEKAMCIDANYWKGPDNHGQRTIILECDELGHANINGHDFLKRIYSIWGKCPTLTAVCGGNQERKIAIDNINWRKLTPLECERLQTFPDNYTEGISNTQRYKALGNSFTVDVIAHILSFMK